MVRLPIRTYVDTSVFGGVLDDELRHASERFFERVRARRVALVISGLVEDELEGSLPPVRRVFDGMLRCAELLETGEEAYALQTAYVDHGVVTERWAADALHVAAASVGGCPMIVSWNCKHIVNVRRVPLYNAVNALMGYPPRAIHSPLEVEFDGEEL
jgi:hypothetical protein